ncbi:MAG: serine--tRNA ligase [bacterium]|nr:serine--tRNA ligase [bacterium]
MLDPRCLADRRQEIEESCRKRGIKADVASAVASYEQVAARQTELNDANRRRNEHQKAGKQKLDDEQRAAHTAEGRALKEAVARIEADLAVARADLEERAGALPNFIHPDVPEGGEEDFRLLRRVGEPTTFDFEARDHLELGIQQGLLDFEAGARVTGNKFYYLKNGAVLLELALQRYALDILIEEGFVPHITPDLARPEIVAGIGYNPRGEETQIYSLSNADLCLVGTAEITLGGLHADAILDEDDLPLKLAGISHCFRTEAGAAGRESKGLYRVHQFTKVEMFVITRPEDSEAMHENLLAIEERIFGGLELPYQVVDIASGDLGAPAFRKYDIEAWMPGRGEGGSYGEVSSASNCTDYQARRLKTRFRRKDTKKNELVHMLNGTAVANSRAILAVLENHQRADGTIGVPKALQPYMGRDTIGPGTSSS